MQLGKSEKLNLDYTVRDYVAISLPLKVQNRFNVLDNASETSDVTDDTMPGHDAPKTKHNYI